VAHAHFSRGRFGAQREANPRTATLCATDMQVVSAVRRHLVKRRRRACTRSVTARVPGMVLDTMDGQNFAVDAG
jgi:ribonuclease P protein component